MPIWWEVQNTIRFSFKTGFSWQPFHKTNVRYCAEHAASTPYQRLIDMNSITYLSRLPQVDSSDWMQNINWIQNKVLNKLKWYKFDYLIMRSVGKRPTVPTICTIQNGYADKRIGFTGVESIYAAHFQFMPRATLPYMIILLYCCTDCDQS